MSDALAGLEPAPRPARAAVMADESGDTPTPPPPAAPRGEPPTAPPWEGPYGGWGCAGRDMSPLIPPAGGGSGSGTRSFRRWAVGLASRSGMESYIPHLSDPIGVTQVGHGGPTPSEIAARIWASHSAAVHAATSLCVCTVIAFLKRLHTPRRAMRSRRGRKSRTRRRRGGGRDDTRPLSAPLMAAATAPGLKAGGHASLAARQ